MDRELMPLFPAYASCSNKLTCECVFSCITTRSLTKSTFRASIFMLKQHFKVVFPASFLRLVPRTYLTLKMADNCKALSHVPPHFHPVSLLPLPPPLFLGTSALGSSPVGTFVTSSMILINSSPKNKNWKLIATFNF